MVEFTHRADAQSLFVTNFGNGKIGAYTTSGAVVNASLVSGLSQPVGIAVSGSNIYVTEKFNGTIGAYNTTSGAVVNANLVSGLNNPSGIAVSGSNIYVVNEQNGTIGAYNTTSGAVVNANLVSGLNNPSGIAVSGSNIYVTELFNGTIGVYTTSGVLVNASLVSGLSFPYFLSVVDATDNTNGGGGSGSSGTPTQVNIFAGTSFSLGSIGVTATPVLAGGTLVLSRGDSSSVSIAITSAGGSIQSPTSGSATLSGVFSGTGGLTFTNSGGTGTIILSGANTYSGGTTVSSGILQGNTTSLQGPITNNGKLVFDQPSTGTFSGTIAGSGAVFVQNSGTVILSGANTYSGGTIVSSGTLQGNTTSLQGAFTNNGKLVFDQPSTGNFSGTIAGSGAVFVQNSGTIILSGANTYSGGTTVSGGMLSVAGASPTGTGDVFVASAGTLMGTGTIAGNGLVSGLLKPGNSPGYLSFAQNLTLNTGSTYQQDIAGTAQASSTSPVGASGYYSFVNVGSQLTINSGATLTPRLSNLFNASEAGYGSRIYVPVLGDRFRIITAAGGIIGRFATLTQPSELRGGTQFIVFYNVNGSNSLDLATVPTSYSTTLHSSTTNAKSVAGVLDQLLGLNKAGMSSSAQDSLLYAVAGQKAANLPGFARSLAGEIHSASVATLPQTTQRLQQSVLGRLGDYPMAPSKLKNADNVAGTAVADGRAWGEIAYQRTERESNSGGNGYDSNLYQIVTGVDAYSNAELGLKLGGGITLSNTTVAANGGTSTIQQGSLFVYGKMPVLQDYVLDGMASVGLSSTNLSRNDPTGYTGGFSSKAVLGNDALVSAGISRAFESKELRVTPYARLSYQYVGQNSYDEGSGAAALNIASFSDSAVRGMIGVAAGSLNKDPLKDDYTYRANMAVGADTSGLLNPKLNTTLGGYSSTVTTATAGSAFLQVGFYGTVKISDNAYAYAGVSGEARTGQTLYGGSVGLRIAF